METRWYTADELLELAHDYAHARGYRASHGWIYNREGRKVAKGWQGFVSYLMRNGAIDELDWVETPNAGLPTRTLRYFVVKPLDLENL